MPKFFGPKSPVDWVYGVNAYLQLSAVAKVSRTKKSGRILFRVIVMVVILV
jgi:hypothetical protein